MAERDLYSILGVSRDAPEKEIDSAYRRLARKCHPDVNPGDKQAEERFKEIAAAHEVLSDSEKRRLYDEFGDEARKIGFDPEKARAYREWEQRAHAASSWRGVEGDPLGGFGGSGAGGIDLGELFGDLLGKTPKQPPGPRPGSDLSAEMTLPFRDAVLGTEREISLQKPAICGTCHGSGIRGGAAPSSCSQCKGTGTADVARGPIQFRGPCPRCAGSGREPGPACTACGGEGTVPRTAELRVRIPPGVESGQVIRLAGQGTPGRMGAPPGDLLVEIHVSAHPHLTRRGRDLSMDLPVTVPEAMLGATVAVPTFHGAVSIKIPPGSQNGKKLRVRGKGVPPHGGRAAGDLYLTVSVVLPKADPAAAESAVRGFEKLYDEDVRSSLRL